MVGVMGVCAVCFTLRAILIVLLLQYIDVHGVRASATCAADSTGRLTRHCHVLRAPCSRCHFQPCQRVYGMSERTGLPGCCRLCACYLSCVGLAGRRSPHRSFRLCEIPLRLIFQEEARVTRRRHRGALPAGIQIHSWGRPRGIGRAVAAGRAIRVGRHMLQTRTRPQHCPAHQRALRITDATKVEMRKRDCWMAGQERNCRYCGAGRTARRSLMPRCARQSRECK